MRESYRLLLALLTLSLFFAGVSLAEDGAPATRSLDDFETSGPAVGDDPLECGELLMNASVHYDGFAWQYAGVVEPDYGAFAECYSGSYEICSVVIHLGQIGNYSGQTMDIYVWDDEGGIPGAVVCFLADVDPGPISFHPEYDRHVFPIAGCCVDGDWWVGCWPNWPGEAAGWFVADDFEGFGGCPLTKIAPGIGFPTGWQNVSVAWGPTQALWIGAEVTECGPSPVLESSWGRVKSLF